MNVAIILAAGESRRMGQPKQLLPFGDKTMLDCVIEAFRSPRVDEIRVVLGYKADEIAAKIGSGVMSVSRRRAEPARPTNDRVGRGGPTAPHIKIVRNDRYRQGMFTSIQAGLRALPKKTRLILIAVGDQPRLKRETVELLIDKFETERHKILIPSYNGRQGHPPVLRAKYAKEILAMDESMTLKHFYAAHADDITRLVVEDEGALVDIDDRASYERELRKQSDDTRPTPRTDSTQAVVGRVAPRGAGKLRRNADDMPHQKTQSTTTGASTQAVVGRVPPRGAGARTKSPRRLRRLNTTWAGDGFPCFFLTICVEGRAQVLADGKTHSRLLEFLLTSPQRYGWWPSRYVIMPDHLHLLVRRGEPPRGATRPTTLGEWVKALKAVVGTREVKWQKGFFDHLLRTEESEAEKWEYIRQNPVRAGLVAHAEDWAFAGEINEKAKEPPRGGTRPTT